MQSKQKSIAVIGAGISGLTAARELLKKGFVVTIFEKSTGLGGRLNTKSRDGFQFDMGAPYFTARDSIFIDQVNQWINEGQVKVWSNFKAAKIENNKIIQSPDNEIRYVGNPKMQNLVNEMVNKEIVRFEKVDRIERKNNEWIINNNEEQKYGWIVLGIPEQQAKALYPGLRMNQEDSSAACFTVVLGFKEKINVNFTFAFIKDSFISKLYNDSSKPDRPTEYDVWVVHTDPYWTQSNLNIDKAELLQLTIKEFNKLLELKMDIVDKSYVHRWLYAQHYQYPDIQDGFVIDSEQQIGFCGDWCNKGRVEGAFMSGYQLAMRLSQ